PTNGATYQLAEQLPTNGASHQLAEQLPTNGASHQLAEQHPTRNWRSSIQQAGRHPTEVGNLWDDAPSVDLPIPPLLRDSP
ncbi:MAG: hypothetical protein WCS37_17550, partial [Chloroflexota bacterium]